MMHMIPTLTTKKLTLRKKMIEEVMLDRWLLDQIDEAEIVDIVDEIDDFNIVNSDWRQSASQELSSEVMEMLS